MAEGERSVAGDATVAGKEAVPAILELAPPAKSGNRNILVIGCGLCTTMISLALVYLLEKYADTNVMGWYVDYCLPMGAVLVGLVATSGYGLAAWRSGLKIRRGLLVTIMVLQVGAYFAAKYTEFFVQGPLVNNITGMPINFLEYFHTTTVNMAWKDDAGKLSEPLGGMGYLLRAGEVIGFVIGTLVSPLVLSKKPYCDLCEQYMKEMSLVLLPGSTTKAGHLFGKKAIAMTNEQVMEAGMTDVVELVSLATAGDASGFAAKRAALAPLRAQAKKLSRQINVQLVSCARCASGRLEIKQVETTGRHSAITKLGESPVSQQFVRELRDQGKV